MRIRSADISVLGKGECLYWSTGVELVEYRWLYNVVLAKLCLADLPLFVNARWTINTLSLLNFRLRPAREWGIPRNPRDSRGMEVLRAMQSFCGMETNVFVGFPRVWKIFTGFPRECSCILTFVVHLHQQMNQTSTSFIRETLSACLITVITQIGNLASANVVNLLSINKQFCGNGWGWNRMVVLGVGWNGR